MPNRAYLIDRSAWLFALKRNFVPAIKDRIDHLLGSDGVVTTGIVKLEIISGARTKKEFQRLKERPNALDSVDMSESLWPKAYALGFDLRRKGVTVPHTDVLIAACALHSGAILVHADIHFDLIAKHTGVKVESLVHSIQINDADKDT